MKWKPIDVISGIIIVGCFILLGLGRDTVISWVLLGVVGGYYGIDLTPWLKVGRNLPKKKADESHTPPTDKPPVGHASGSNSNDMKEG